MITKDEIKKYLKSEYVSIRINGSVTDEEWKKYAEICSEANSKREVDEIVRYQEYYKVDLPIVKRAIFGNDTRPVS